MDKNSISNFMRQQRKVLKMTQQDLADRAGIGIRFIRELESGKPRLRLDKVNIVLDLFGHTLAPVSYQEQRNNSMANESLSCTAKIIDIQ